MRGPLARVRFFGHPLVALPVMGLCSYCLYLWSQNSSAFLLGIGSLFILAWIVKAQRVMGQYHRWRKAWDGMAEPRTSRPPLSASAMATIATAVLIGGGFVVAASGLLPPDDSATLSGLSILGASGAAMFALARIAWRVVTRAGRTDRTVPVKVAVTRAVLPPLTLADAYDALPAHSRQAIDGCRP